jgi:hypothetical protein
MGRGVWSLRVRNNRGDWRPEARNSFETIDSRWRDRMPSNNHREQDFSSHARSSLSLLLPRRVRRGERLTNKGDS